ESTEHFAGHHGNPAFVDPASGHALMYRVDDDAHAAGLEHFVDASCDLRSELFLDLEAASVAVDDPRQLADAHHPIARQVADMRAPDDRRHMMLTERFKRDIAQDHHFV